MRNYLDLPHKIRIACAARGITMTELAHRLKTTPSNLSQKLKTGKFSSADLVRIADALDAEIRVSFILPDGYQI